MDGVLADFDNAVIALLGKHLNHFPTAQEGWDALIPHRDTLFAHLPKLPDADELVYNVAEIATRYDCPVGVLTAIPRLTTNPTAAKQKKEWIAKHYPFLLRNFQIGPHAQDKQKHCTLTDVLIDDNVRNIQQWNAVGGKGIFHVNAAKTVTELARYFEQLFDKK